MASLNAKCCSSVLFAVALVGILSTHTHGQGFIYSGQLYCDNKTCFVVPADQHNFGTEGNARYKEYIAGDGGQRKAAGTEVLGGFPAPQGRFPYQVSIVFINAASGIQEGCGGTIVTEAVVVTAAHCACSVQHGQQVPHGEFQIIAGNITRFPGQKRGVNHVHPHPNYKGEGNLANDVAVLFLDKPFILKPKQVESLPLGDFDVPDGATCIVSGWGKTETEENSAILRYSKVQIKPSFECGYDGFNDSKQVCYGGRGHNSCVGNSGGPLVCPHPKSRKWFLYGMVSFGYGGECSQIPSVASRISFWKSWIEDTVRQSHGPTAQSWDTISGPGFIWGQRPPLHHFAAPHHPYAPFPFWHPGFQTSKLSKYQHDVQRFSAYFTKK